MVLKPASKPISVSSICARVHTLAGIESPRLYSQTYFGTKRLVEQYVEEGSLPHERVDDSGKVFDVFE